MGNGDGNLSKDGTRYGEILYCPHCEIRIDERERDDCPRCGWFEPRSETGLFYDRNDDSTVSGLTLTEVRERFRRRQRLAS